MAVKERESKKDQANGKSQSCEDSNVAADAMSIESIPEKKLKKLLHWDELEEWQKDNEYIYSGYVRSENSMKAVLRSLTFIHNETGNIYTHLIPSLLISLALLSAVVKCSPPLILFEIGCVLCMGMSATFHCFKSHSHHISILGNKLDYLGICVLIASSMIAIIEIAFKDRPFEHHIFISITSILCVACSYVSLSDTFRSRDYRPIRATMFICYGLSGILPIFVGWLQFGAEEVSNRASCPWLFAEAFLYIFGAVLYAVRFPEKFAPGNFDLIGHSHQIFHVFVVLAAYCHYNALINSQIYMSMHYKANFT